MPSIEEAQEALKDLGLPKAQQTEMAACVLLALCRLLPEERWEESRRESVTITKGIMAFVRQHYQKDYAPNTRETFRRQVLHQFVQARIADYNPDNPALATNSPHAHYAIAKEALTAIQTYGTEQWQGAVEEFVRQQPTLTTLYETARQFNRVPARLPDGTQFDLSPGKHNELQAAIVEEFASRFAPDAHVLYLGDTAQKMLVVDTQRLLTLGVPVTEHSKLPDVVMHDEARNWLFLVEAVTSHGPISPKRIVELEILLASCTSGRIYVSAFPDFATFRKHLTDIAWDTEVWLSDMPDHMIHFNGDRFLGPRT